MRSFSFEELLLLSPFERRARRIQFDERATIIRSDENGTGKSSLIKSLFWALGASPVAQSRPWEAAHVRALVRIRIESERLWVLRIGDEFVLYNGDKRCIGHFRGIVKELAPIMGERFGFNLRLPSRQDKFTSLPPAYMLLPFYMDQDGGWNEAWAGFEGLMAFGNWKKPLIEYHAGIRGHSYYEALAAKERFEKRASELELQRESLRSVFSDLEHKFEATRFNLDYSEFESELRELLELCSNLRVREEAHKERLAQLRSREDSVAAQLAIAEHARDELAKDQKFAAAMADTVSCPTCGAHYENSFQERFLSAADEEMCRELTITLSQERHDIRDEVAGLITKARRTTDEIAKIERILAKKQGEIELRDLIRQEGRQELRQAMRSQLETFDNDIQNAWASAGVYSAQMKALDNKRRRKDVKGYYSALMQEFRDWLELPNLSDHEVSTVSRAPSGRGSEKPRILLAYKVAFLHVVRRFSKCQRFPFVIDSPNQQDQDEQNLSRMMSFLGQHLPEDTQLILGGVRTEGLGLKAKTILLEEKGRVLRESEFEDIRAVFEEFFEAGRAEGA